MLPRDADSESRHCHIVHFYEDDGVVCGAIADFFASGHALGEPLVLLSTPEHRDGVGAQLRSRGIDLEQGSSGDGAGLAFFDANAILDRVMVGPMLDEARFHTVMEEVFGSVTGRAGGRVRAFGELVDLLCHRGNGEAALQMEKLWHALTRDHPLSLLCAYTMGNLYREVNGNLYERICATHTEVAGLRAVGD